MKVGDLIRFTKTGAIAVVVEIEVYAETSTERVRVYVTWEEDGEQHTGDQWFTRDYLLQCAEPATFDHSAMCGGVL